MGILAITDMGELKDSDQVIVKGHLIYWVSPSAHDH